MPKPENNPRQPDKASDLMPMNLIRTESVLSRFPVHSLSKKGTVQVHVLRKNADGEAAIKWEVSYNEQHGPAGQLAYKLDTLIVNRRWKRRNVRFRNSSVSARCATSRKNSEVGIPTK